MSLFLGQEILEELLDHRAVKRMVTKWFSKGVAEEVRRLVEMARNLIEGYQTPREFEADWKWIRLAVPLQLRLMVEQILWDKRGGWRDLVTGFGPVKGRTASAARKGRK